MSVELYKSAREYLSRNNISVGVFECRFAKETAREEERYIKGVVLEPTIGKDVLNPDTDNDVYTEGDVRFAAHWFAEHGWRMKIQHQIASERDIVILENTITDVEYKLNGEVVHKGSWLMANRVYNEEIWQMIKDGRITGFSIGGLGSREPITPAQIRQLRAKSRWG